MYKSPSQSLTHLFPLSLLGKIIDPAESVKNLVVTLDANNLMQKHMANLCCVCYYHLQELWRVSRYVTHEMAVKVTNALVSSHLNYCNSLLYHTKKHVCIMILQRVQNTLCDIMYKVIKFSHVTLFLYKLHWLPH